MSLTTDEGGTMVTKKIAVERVTFVSNRSFEEVLGLLDKGIGRPNLGELGRRLNEAPTFGSMHPRFAVWWGVRT